MPSPTALSLRYLRDRGHAAEVVERWLRIPGKEIRRDLFRCIDIIAAHGRQGILLGVQATSLPNVGARLAKAKEQPGLKQWLQAGGRFEVHGWVKRHERWVVKVVSIEAADMTAVVTRTIPRCNGRIRQRDLFDAFDLEAVSGR